jgi:hypothetical protein
MFSGLSGVPAIATERKIASGARIEGFILQTFFRHSDGSLNVEDVNMRETMEILSL